jgi:hypothetical protein
MSDFSNYPAGSKAVYTRYAGGTGGKYFSKTTCQNRAMGYVFCAPNENWALRRVSAM